MRAVIERLDHQFLNEVAAVRREESVGRKHRRVFLRGDDQRPGVEVRCRCAIREVKVWETDIQSATYRP